jgi:hypothetical protein
METATITIEMCEAMYAHYAGLLCRKDLSSEAREYAEEAQLYYIYMHELMIDFHIYAEQLGF